MLLLASGWCTTVLSCPCGFSFGIPPSAFCLGRTQERRATTTSLQRSTRRQGGEELLLDVRASLWLSGHHSVYCLAPFQLSNEPIQDERRSPPRLHLFRSNRTTTGATGRLLEQQADVERGLYKGSISPPTPYNPGVASKDGIQALRSHRSHCIYLCTIQK